MHPIIKRLALSGLMFLPAACAPYYSRQYYDTSYYPGQYQSSSGYYYPGQYQGGYGVIERNYYNTYAYQTPSYRTYDHHHHDGDDHRYQDRRYRDTQRFPAPSGTAYRQHDSHDHGTNGYYNWNKQTPKPYGNRQSAWDHQQRDNRNDGRQLRPDEPDARGQWQRQQNLAQQETGPQNRGFENRSAERTDSGWQNTVPTQQNEQRGRRGQGGQRHGGRAEGQSGE
ncbi:hypothetical protein [Methylomicrobium sp. Wu6]|uniref:hypothetical protein n=1 Tax=Methylomicrobium sp. Wu6 TaxID=3107928 RepID=UPI002DD6B0B4|nr:hypothetical protein [Methylomicrobium sp. Wu6]MEC4747631.1 hypothetical protein [Methylomicrobium sp. Wu6]